jgi:hypothetical protein
MGNENLVSKNIMNFLRYFIKAGRFFYHGICDARHILNKIRDGLIWIDERIKGIYHLLSIKNLYRDLGYSIRCCIRAGCFYVHDRVHEVNFGKNFFTAENREKELRRGVL